MKIFVDTNIFLDLILKRDDYNKSLIILNAIEKRVFQGVIADITVLNIDYIAKKQVKEIRDFLKFISLLFEILGADNNIIEEALDIENSDLEDNLQYTLAKKSNCDLIVSNDKAFYKKDIDVFTSSDFIKKYL
ncbi:type II toxin-antitoxin system VapC family toxin [Arcobacter vandammei]|uniref:type II toxin-antitoxin system VapC family toxin n=1 Tax=Arcobacter vandammei TaxID=2782243 RepID=UPI0018E04FAF|nr:PIN domain-containing protein [Arcobacter vandammei]